MTAPTPTEVQVGATPAAARPRTLRIPERLSYHPALDGIRGLAVLAVMLFHYDERWLPGGFLGVDVFFVLSGFLITSLLLISFAKSGSVVSRDFWARRARRLLPALFLMLVLFSVYYAFVADPADSASIRGGSLATLFFFKNYWDALSSHSSRWLSHAWSLSVEEQFYLVWPLLLVALVRVSRHRTLRLLVVLGALISASALLRLAWSFRNPSYANEALETRASALLVGAVVAIGAMSFTALSRAAQRTLNILAGAALGVLLACFAIARTDSYAWLWYGGALLVAIASALVIVAATHGTGLVQRALSSRLLCGVGLISYGLYLYHLVIFQWASRERLHVPEWERVCVCFGVSFVLASLSYLLIERPIRGGSFPRLQRPISAALVLGLVLSLVVWSANLNSLSLPNGVSLAMRLNWRQLAASSPPATDRILVAGDALAASLATGLPRDLHDTTSVSHAALTNCGLAGGDVVIGDAHYTSSGCENWRGVYATAVDDFRPRTAIFLIGVKEVFDRQVGNRTLRVGTTEYERYLVDRLEVARRTLTKRGARFVLVGAPCMQPFASANAPDVFAVVRNDARRIAWLNQVLERYANREKISFVDIATMLCANSRRQDPQAIATALTSTESSKVWTRLLR